LARVLYRMLVSVPGTGEIPVAILVLFGSSMSVSDFMRCGKGWGKGPFELNVDHSGIGRCFSGRSLLLLAQWESNSPSGFVCLLSTLPLPPIGDSFRSGAYATFALCLLFAACVPPYVRPMRLVIEETWGGGELAGGSRPGVTRTPRRCGRRSTESTSGSRAPSWSPCGV